MNVKQIVADYQVAQRSQQEAQARLAEFAANAERDRRQRNAEAVAIHLRTVILPIVMVAEADITAAGYVCDATLKPRDDAPVAGGEQLALQLTFQVFVPNRQQPAWMQYVGESQGANIMLTECHGSATNPIMQWKDVFSTYTTQQVESQVEAFVRTIFPS